jgi:hypothetical protein
MVPVNRTPRVVYEQGDHVCTVYNSDEERVSAAVQFVRDGLAWHQRCVYVCCDEDPDGFRSALKSAAIDVAAHEAEGALVLLTKADAHLNRGSFDPARMIAAIDAALQDALNSGFAGLRAAGEMTWLLDEAPGADRIVEYEALLNRYCSNKPVILLCQYNRRSMSPHLLDHCLATHPWVRMEGPILLANPFYEPPEAAVSRTADPGDVERKLGHLESARRRALF